MNPHDVILAPVLSEKAVGDMTLGKYSFYVHPGANRTQIKDAIELVFKVEVTKINLQNREGKVIRQGRYRTAPRAEEGHRHTQGRAAHRAARRPLLRREGKEMAKHYRPYTPSRRAMTTADFDEVTRTSRRSRSCAP